ncbi:hypothetical protein BDY24DRAFT_395766 [Mrakia frigida]|uniref:uncharacterized protein n=1 Tax=Mrakia frigida TaxID=29902 RepID=UPI003FCC01C3
MDLSLLDLSDPDFTLRLPSELLTLIADHLPVPPTLCSHLSKGVLQGTFETQKLGMAAAPSLRLFGSSPSASPPNSASKELGAMRLVCKRWEVATRSVLFSRGRVKRVEELEFWCGEGARKGLSGCVQRLDLLVQPFVEKASYDDNLPEPSLVLEALLGAMPGLSKLSIQAPLPLTLLETLLLPESEEFNRIERLVDLALVIQTTRWDDPDFASALSRHSRTLPIPAILPFLSLHRHLRSLHLGGCQLSPLDVASLLSGLASTGIKLETFSVELLLVEGKELEDRKEVLKVAGEEMGRSLRMIRFAGVVVPLDVVVSKEDLKELPNLLRSFTRLEGIRLGLRSNGHIQGVRLRKIASLMGRGCRTLRRGVEGAILWEQFWPEEVFVYEEVGWNPESESEESALKEGREE